MASCSRFRAGLSTVGGDVATHEDIPAVAAAMLRVGPDRHTGMKYWSTVKLSAEPQIVDSLTRTLYPKSTSRMQRPEHVAMYIQAGHAQICTSIPKTPFRQITTRPRTGHM